MKQKIKELCTDFSNWKYRRKALHVVKENAKRGVQADQITVDWITACIIERKQESRRKELVEAHAKLKEDALFVEWLKTQK